MSERILWEKENKTREVGLVQQKWPEVKTSSKVSALEVKKNLGSLDMALLCCWHVLSENLLWCWAFMLNLFSVNNPSHLIMKKWNKCCLFKKKKKNSKAIKTAIDWASKNRAFATSLQSCLTLCDPMDCSPPGSSVHGILQARILEWVARPFSRGSSRPRDWTHVSLCLLHCRWVHNF